MKRLNYLILTLLFFIGNAAAASPIYTEDKLAIMVTADKPEFVIKLTSNPTTGYSWYLREYDNNIISPVKHYFGAPTRQLVGAVGYELWTLKVKPAGFIVPQQTIVRFVYARPWDAEDQAKQLVFRVTTH